MKSLLLAFAVTVFTVTSPAAQTPPPAPPQSSAPAESSVSDSSLTGGTVINATLNSSVDSKKAKTGTQVTAETSEPVKSTDGRTVLPKGTKLTGHVTQASARSGKEGEAALGIQFDKAKLKNGQELPLANIGIQALAAPAREASNYGGNPEPMTTTPGAPANNPSMAGSRGARSESTPQTTTPAAQPPNPTSSASTPTGPEANAAGPLPANTRGVYGIEGLRIAPAQSGEGALLTSTGKNVHLDSGTRLLLVVQPQGGTASPSR
jgi:hypothetical protein